MNNTTIKKLDWDSDFFLKNIAEISLVNDEIPTIENDIYDLIVIKQDIELPFEVEGYSQSFKETKVIFEKNLTKFKVGEFSEIRDSDKEDKEFSYFTDLAYESGKMSRFRLDEKFGEAKFQDLYDLWVINSLNKKFAIKLFFIEKDHKAIGFVTLQQDNNIGKIGLIATHPDFQGQGLGRKLLEYTENYCISNNIFQLEIPTQEENINACKFYHKMGYLVKEKIVIKHFWKDEGN